jgi:hypothetical protein
MQEQQKRFLTCFTAVSYCPVKLHTWGRQL